MARRRSPSPLPMLVAFVGATVIVAALVFGGRIVDWARHRLGPEHEPNLSAVDLRNVHAELLPNWVIAASRTSKDGGKKAEEKAFDALAKGIAQDGNLAGWAEELREIVNAPLLSQNAAQAVAITDAWSRYLDGHGEPFFVRANVILSPSVIFYATSLETLADFQLEVEQHTIRARVVRRIDETNVRETYLGLVSDNVDGAVVITDRVLEFGLDNVWPLLAPGTAMALPDPALVFAEAVRNEAQAALDPASFAVLADTARVRTGMVAARNAIDERAECGNRFRIFRLPATGLLPPTLAQLSELATDEGSCPAVTTAEAAALVEGTSRLAAVKDLDAALAQLLAWLTRGIVLHEVRHAADAARLGDLRKPMPCEICDDDDSARMRAELSAYLASVAWSKSPATVLYQACTSAIARPLGPHAEAIALMLEAADRTCEQGPLPDHPGTLRPLEARAFGRSDALALPDDYPASLALQP